GGAGQSGDDALRRQFADGRVSVVRNEDIAGSIGREGEREIEFRLGGRSIRAAVDPNLPGHGGYRAIGRDLANGAIAFIGYEQISLGIKSQTNGVIKLRGDADTIIGAARANTARKSGHGPIGSYFPDGVIGSISHENI